MPIRRLPHPSSSPMRAAAQPVIARTTVAGRASLETPPTNSAPSTPTQTTTPLPAPAPPIEVLIASLSPLPSASTNSTASTTSATSPASASASASSAYTSAHASANVSPSTATGDSVTNGIGMGMGMGIGGDPSITQSSNLNPNPSLNLTYAQQLVEALMAGPVLEPSRLLGPIKGLCAPSQSPAVRAAGYAIIKWYCENQIGAGQLPLGALEKKHVWDSLCAAGSAWFPETGGPRLDALEAFLTCDPDAEGEQNVLEEIKNWMTDAVDLILTSSVSPLPPTPNLNTTFNTGIHATATIDAKEMIAQERDAYVERVDQILASLMFKSKLKSTSTSGSGPTLTPLSDYEVRSIIEMYSSWTDRAVREEYRHPSSVISISSMTVTAATITPRPQVSHSTHGPHGRKVSSTSAFSFPSSIDEREQRERWNSRASHVILGGMFLDLIERCLKEHVLIPNQVLPQVLSTLCYILALTMKPIPPGFATSGLNSSKSTITSPAHGLASTPVFQSQSNSSSSTHLPLTMANGNNNGNSNNGTNSAEGIQVPSTPRMQEEKNSIEIDERAAKLTQELLTNSLYTASSVQHIKALLLPSASNSQSHFVASGAMRAVRLAVITSLQSELARKQLNDVVSNHFNPSGAPVLFGDTQMYEMGWKGTSGGRDLRFEKVGGGVKEAVVQWRLKGNQEGKEGVLIECCGLIMDVLTLSPKGAVSEVSRFAGELIQELVEIVKEYRTPDGSIYRLRLGAPSSAPTPLLNSICDLLRLPLGHNVTKPALSTILLSLSEHLNDSDALAVISHLQASGQLSPFFPDWAKNFRLLINAFYGNARAYPRSRRMIATQLAKVYSEITDIDHEDLRGEIVEDMVAMWERTLYEETNDDILHAAFDVTSKEIVLSTMADDNAASPIAERIMALWMKVAITAPPYWETDRILMTSITPNYYYTPSAVSTPNPEVSGYRSLHSPNPSLPLNSLNPSATFSSPSLIPSEPPTPSLDPSYPAQISSQAQTQLGTPSQQRQGRAVLAVIFLIKAFNNLAFRSPQSLKILLADAARHQSASAASMAIALFRGIVQLMGIAKDRIRRVDDPTYVNGGDENESFDRVQCPKARLVIVQWLLRLRADREHRIYAVGEIENEVAPYAGLIYRTESSKSDSQQPTQADRASRDLPTGIAERRRHRAETKGATDLRTHRPMERDKEREQSSRDQTREPRGRGTPDALGASTSRSRSRPPASPQTPLRNTRPVELLWSLPDPLAIELEKHATRPSPAMATFRSFKEEQGLFWLHVDYYVQTIADILENGRDWEIVSYILCHLPIQLANKHFFCGPKTKVQIRRLVLVICNAINDDRLCGNMDLLYPPEVLQVDVQALLYHTLTVLISYHKSFDPLVGEYDQQAKSIKSDIVEVIYRGLAKDEATNKPCLEALSIAVYELPEQMAKFTGPIIEKLSRIMSNPNMAVHILELLVIIGYTPKLYSGSFREEEYNRVFGVALLYIEHHYRPDASTLRTSDGRDSYSLAQHVLNTAFFVIYIWFLAIKLEDRARYVSFITKQLLIANRKEVMEPTTEVCFDWLARYAYSNADPKSAPSFLYRSIVAPGSGEFNITRNWDEQHAIEMDNTAVIKAWKLGNSIVTISTMKKPAGWVRIVSRRPSGLTELICRLENWPHVSPGDYAPDLVSMPATMLADRPMFEDGDESLDIEEELLDRLVNDIFEQSDVIQDLKKPDPISGYVWSGVAPSQRRKDVTVDPAYIALLLSAYPSGMMTRPSRYPDYNALKDVLRAIDYTPVIDTHKVGVLYVAPGQTTEAEILANQHGSPAYTRFLAELGRVIKPSNRLEVYTGGLRRETHGEWAYAWWDDMSQIIYHVGTIMPNINNCLFKKQEIGNDGVKIIWNDAGTPFKFDTIPSEYTLINVIVEPHSVGARGAYSDNLHENEYFRVTLQTASNLPRITPIGEFKIVSAEKLSQVLRHFTLLASLFCKAWEMTGMDSDRRYPLQTNWQGRLRYITTSESKLPPKPKEDDPDQRSTGLVYREAARDFTRAY